MNISHLIKSSAGIAAAVAIFAGCSGGASQSPLGALVPTQQSASTSSLKDRLLGRRPTALAAMIGAVDVRPDRRRFGPQVFPAGRSLWISDYGTNDIEVYPYPMPSPTATPAATITGLNGTQGECIGVKDIVFVTNTNASQILAYTHNGSLIATVNDPGQYPVGCAYDATNHRLAVSNIATTSGGPGSISLYHGVCCSFGTPTVITDPSFGNLYFLGFRPNNNLFVDGINSSGAVSYWRLTTPLYPVTQIGFTPSTLIGFPGGVQWDGHYMTVGDQYAGTVTRVTGIGTAVIAGTTTLAGASSCDAVQYFIGNGSLPITNPARVSVPEAGCPSAVDFPYFVASAPVQATGSGLTFPIGSAVSP